MFRSYFLTFEGESRADHHTWDHAHESPSVMTTPLIVLAFGAAVMGVLGILPWMSHIPGFGWLHGRELLFQQYLAPITDAWKDVLKYQNLPLFYPNFQSESLKITLEIVFASVSVVMGVGGLLVAYAMYGGRQPLHADEKLGRLPVYDVAQAKFFVDEVYENTVIRAVYEGSTTATGIDRNFVDGSMSRLITGIRSLAVQLRSLQGGYIQVYAVAFMGGIILLLLLA
jgi:NADH-quinone oxidoreductase subunit L